MYRKRNPEWIRHLDFEIWDIFCLIIALIISIAIRHGGFGQQSILDVYIQYAAIMVVVDIMIVLSGHNYKNIIQRGEWAELMAVLKQVTTTEVISILAIYLIHTSGEMSRIVFLLNWAIGVLLSWSVHVLWKIVIRNRVKGNLNKSHMMLIALPDRCDALLQKLTDKTYRRYRITSIGLLNSEEPGKELVHTISVVREEAAIIEYLTYNVVDEVFIDVSGTDKKYELLVKKILAMGIPVHMGMGVLPTGMPNETLTHYNDVMAVTTTISVAESWKLFVKRILDICGAIVGLIITGVASLFVVPAIKKADPGPAFFSQERVGRNGRIFKMHKFRSMYMDAEARKAELMAENEMQGLMFKMENDPRIIGSEKGPGKGIGNFIRKTSIDEFPQFWNVLKGEMSLVGTRPPTKDEYAQYSAYHKVRLAMKPGITGMWQVSGRSDITDFDEVIRLDAEYITNWSVGLDIKIILKTVKVVLAGSGSR